MNEPASSHSPFGLLSSQLRGRFFWLLAGVIIVGALLALNRIPQGVGVHPAPTYTLSQLPALVASSWARMMAAYLCAVIFAISIGTLAATSDARAKILLPALDILQSVPLLGFFPTAIHWFMNIGDRRVGMEMAAVFLIFTSQSWNIVFGVYDAVKSIPAEAREALRSLGLGPLAIFRRLYLPAALPRIVDNSVLSWANGWYFLMACEIIAQGPLSFELPGIGSFLSHSIDAGQWNHTLYGLLALVLVILAMDMFLWRPLGLISGLYRFESSKQQAAPSHMAERVLAIYRSGRIFAPVRAALDLIGRLWVRVEARLEAPSESGFRTQPVWRWGSLVSIGLFWGVFLWALMYAVLGLVAALVPPWSMSPLTVMTAVFVSLFRIVLAYGVSVIWILPVVYLIHRNNSALRIFQSVTQVLASIPATAFFPLLAVAALKIFHSVESAVLLLLLTGMQWYLLFNVIGGARGLPNDIREAASSLGVRRRLYIGKVYAPSIVQSLVTGSITAVGGGWNALIIAEYFKLGDKVYRVFGIGSILAQATYEKVDEKLLSLSIFFMVALILVLNKTLWQPLYRWSEQKFRLEG